MYFSSIPAVRRRWCPLAEAMSSHGTVLLSALLLYHVLFKHLFTLHQNLLELHLKRLKARSAELNILAPSETIGFTITAKHRTCIYMTFSFFNMFGLKMTLN